MDKPERVVDELPMGEIADAVAKVSMAVENLRAGKLNDKALLILISAASGQPQKIVKAVLNGMADMKTLFLKP